VGAVGRSPAAIRDRVAANAVAGSIGVVSTASKVDATRASAAIVA